MSESPGLALRESAASSSATPLEHRESRPIWPLCSQPHPTLHIMAHFSQLVNPFRVFLVYPLHRESSIGAAGSCPRPHLVLPANSCYTAMVQDTNGAEAMKLTGSRRQQAQQRVSRPQADRLTLALMGLAFFLTAAIAALSADLLLWPASEHPLSQHPPSLEPARSINAFWLETALPASDPLPTSMSYPAAVRIRIPAIGVDRSIMEVPLTYDSQSGTWERDYGQLFRQGRVDLVGHMGQSASPGQPGNTVLVGHNYGYGINGVFLRLGRLKAGQRVEIVNAAGQTFTYSVTEVIQIPWTTKDQQQSAEHQAYLSVGGVERLTLVTCGGSRWAPFPDRVYVVAHPSP